MGLKTYKKMNLTTPRVELAMFENGSLNKSNIKVLNPINNEAEQLFGKQKLVKNIISLDSH